MTSTIRNLHSVLVIALFILLALGSKVNKIHYGAFKYDNIVEDMSDTTDYVLLVDGTKVYGDVEKKSPLLGKIRIFCNKKEYANDQLRGYRKANKFYGKQGKADFPQRIVRGKVNIYVLFTLSSTTGANGREKHYTRTTMYSQKGDDGPMEIFVGQNSMKELLAGCPEAVAMVDKGDRKLTKAIERNRNYLNEAFEMYNNDCKPVK